jgi:hypothetical protein
MELADIVDRLAAVDHELGHVTRHRRAQSAESGGGDISRKIPR